MKKLYVQSLPLKEVIEDLSDELKMEVTQNCDLYEVTIPGSLGKGFIKGMDFVGGVGFIIYDCEFSTDVEIHFTVSKIHPAKFMYLLEGKLEHKFENEDTIHHLGQHQSAIVASNGHNGHILKLKKNQRVKMCSVETDRRVFLEEMRCEIDAINNPLKELFLDVDAKHTFYHEGSYSLKLFDKLRDIDNSNLKGFTRKMFWFSTALGVISEQLINYRADTNLNKNQMKLMEGDVEMVKEATNLIEENLSSPLNIQHLAQRLGTYPPKLQQSFKFVYGSTVNKYITKMRFQKSAELLVQSNDRITDIVNKVGLVNRGYFAKIFREYYGCTPQEYRKKFKSHYAQKLDE